MTTELIVVGTDGLEAGSAAVRWAAREAERSGAMLWIVHAYHGELTSALLDGDDDFTDVSRQVAEAVTCSALSAAHDAAPGVRAVADTLIGSPAARLVQEADDASMVVVGTQRPSRLAGLLRGSVSRHVAMHASCPVVVVRGRDDGAGGPVAVGLDDSDTADQVLGAAFAAAHARSARLVVLRACPPVAPPWYGSVSPIDINGAEDLAAERAWARKCIDAWRERYPAVPVEVSIPHDSPAVALTRASRAARLVVVGSRSRGAFAAALLGSTALQMLRDADCPVLVVHRPGDRSPAARRLAS